MDFKDPLFEPGNDRAQALACRSTLTGCSAGSSDGIQAYAVRENGPAMALTEKVAAPRARPCR